MSGKIVQGANVIKEAVVENNDTSASYRDALEDCFIRVCKELEIPVPLWLKKNTKEFSAFRKTFFSNEQFAEKVKFDKFEIKLE